MLSNVVYGTFSFIIVLFSIRSQTQNYEEEQRRTIRIWVAESLGRDTSGVETILTSMGSETFYKFLDDLLSPISQKLNDLENLDEEAKEKLLKAAKVKKDALIFEKWSRINNIRAEDINAIEKQYDIHSLTHLWLRAYAAKSTDAQMDSVSWDKIFERLPNSRNAIDELNDAMWLHILDQEFKPWHLRQMVVVSLIVAVCVALASYCPYLIVQDSTVIAKHGFLKYLLGLYLSPQRCRAKFKWKEPLLVGNTLTFTVEFFYRNGRKYLVMSADEILVEVCQGSYRVPCVIDIPKSTNGSLTNEVAVRFSVRRAGEYQINVLVGEEERSHIRGSPFKKIFIPCEPDAQQIAFIHHCSVVVCTEKVPYQLLLEPKDKYGNVCTAPEGFDPTDEFSVDLVEISTGRPVTFAFHWDIRPEPWRVVLILNLQNTGLYKGTVFYRGATIKNGEFSVVVLSSGQKAMVESNVKKSRNVSFEVKLLTFNNEPLAKPRKVFLHISPKQLTIKEYILKIIPKRITSFRLCPSTRFYFSLEEKASYLKDANKNEGVLSKIEGNHLLIIDDGCQSPVAILCEERNVILATFTHFLLKNIGGSETFRDKQNFFSHEVRKFHQKNFHERLPLRIDRERLLDSSMKATKGFSISDWCKNFEISFDGEEAVDWGGVRREWFELLCNNLFDPKMSELFCRFKNDKQGLVYPNPKRGSHLKLKFYEFAGKIVGKCLYESALGSYYRQLVKARFSRSFLAQLIGLRVHYKYFEQDDPDLFVTKIKYILENDVDGMDLFFTEDEYDSKGQLVRVIDLIPCGSKIEVTNVNKIQYLDALAQHRLANAVKDEVEHFLKGLNDIIPDHLLAIFDENELELLMCGTGHYSVAELKVNHVASGTGSDFAKVLDWFWTAVSNFTDEEMARLLQFTTGCSQLPAGGFGELNPTFHITSTPAFGILPTAHTCFNQICLPDYDSYSQFERALRLAILEGSEGFGMI